MNVSVNGKNFPTKEGVDKAMDAMLKSIENARQVIEKLGDAMRSARIDIEKD